jgi:hypothetical protein
MSGMTFSVAPPQCGTCGTLLATFNAPCRVCELERRIAALEARLCPREDDDRTPPDEDANRPLGCVHGREWCDDCGWHGGPPN